MNDINACYKDHGKLDPNEDNNSYEYSDIDSQFDGIMDDNDDRVLREQLVQEQAYWDNINKSQNDDTQSGKNNNIRTMSDIIHNVYLNEKYTNNCYKSWIVRKHIVQKRFKKDKCDSNCKVSKENWSSQEIKMTKNKKNKKDKYTNKYPKKVNCFDFDFDFESGLIY